MKPIQLIGSRNIENEKIKDSVEEIINNKDTLYLCATSSLKKIRNKEYNYFTEFNKANINDNQELSRYILDKNRNKKFNLYTISEYQKHLTKYVYKYKNILSNIEQKHLLKYLIDKEFFNKEEKKKLFNCIKNELFDLYSFLEFYDIKIEDDILIKIKNDFSDVEYYIFKIYKSFIELIDKITNDITKIDDEIKVIIDLDNIQEDYNTFQNTLKSIIEETVKLYDVIVFDGFLFFNDIQKNIIKAGVKNNKEIILISKYDSYDKVSSFLDEIYSEFSNDLDVELEISEHNEEYEYIDDSNVLQFIKTEYPEIPKITKQLIDTIQNKFENDKSLCILEPFKNREEELEYIVRDIIKYIREKYNESDKENQNNKQIIEEILKSDVCIVTSIDKEIYEERLDLLFKRNGLYIIPDNNKIKSILNKEIDSIYEEKIYFSKQELLEDNIRYKDGELVSYEDKNRIMNVSSTIRASVKDRPIANYPIGAFIFEIYNIIKEGMSNEKFKLILYSNWKHNQNKNEECWDQYISEFKKIEAYFEDKTEIDEWIEEIENIIKNKSEIINDEIYRYHPFNCVEYKTLYFFSEMLINMKDIITQLNNVNGKLVDHIEELKNQFRQDVLKIDDKEIEFEVQIMKRIYDALDELSSTSKVKNINSKDFAESIRSMIKEWEASQDEKENTLQIQVVNLENMQKFKRSYFIMLEHNKYPRKYTHQFPYTKEIFKILREDQYRINKTPNNANGREFHLKLERYLFKNTLDFTEENLIISYCEKDNSEINNPSIYIEDISSMLNINIEDMLIEHDNDLKTYDFYSEDIDINFGLEKKDLYKTSELIMYDICPKLYYYSSIVKNPIAYTSRFHLCFYYEAVLYNATIRKLVEFSKLANKVYSIHNDELIRIIKIILEEESDIVVKRFDFLTEYEIKDLNDRVLKEIIRQVYFLVIENKYSKSNLFKIDGGTKVKVRNIESETNLKIINCQGNNPFDASERSKDRLDFLIFNKALSTNLNCQLRNKVSFAENILTKILNTNYYKNTLENNKYCEYCKIKEICKMNLIDKE